MSLLSWLTATQQRVRQVEAVAKEEDEFPCYCDENCLNMGDCCQDYKAFCEGDHQFGFKWPFKNCSGIP